MREKEEKHTTPPRQKRNIRWLTKAVAIVMIVAAWWLLPTPHSLTHDLNAICRITARTNYVVPFSDGDTLRLSSKTGQTTDEADNVFAEDTVILSGCFVSELGHVVTSTEALNNAPMRLSADSLSRLLTTEKARLTSLAAEKNEAMRDLDYYARTHSVTDDGYNAVMAFREKNKQQATDVDSLLKLVNKALAQENATATLHCEATMELSVTTHPDKTSSTTPQQVRIYRRPLCLLANSGDFVLMQLTDKRLPALATHFSLSNINDTASAQLLMAYFGNGVLSDVLRLSTPFVLEASYGDGGALTDGAGRFCGIISRGRIISSANVRRFCLNHIGSPKWWTDEVCSSLRRAVIPSSDTTNLHTAAEGYLPRNVEGYRRVSTLYRQKALANCATYFGRSEHESPNGFGATTYRDNSRYVGQWHNGLREGYGMLTDSAGRAFAGRWQADTLAYGRETDSIGTYYGTFNSLLRREGTGTYHRHGKFTYVGEWHNGLREGFGFAVGERQIVQAGIWKNDRFRGEQMIYTADRVYGIDISRYQHEIGRRRYNINWTKLRITRLGAANASRIRGVQDYPVSFVYIKASQGTSIRNRYYAADAAACRRRHIPVGAYHFFSTKATGRAQAQHFLRIAKPKRGDLPPVLDIEPYDRQIEAMGGREVMFREILAWVKYVQASCGTLPVLYVSQTFVNKYMAYAPAELSACQVWIARYGEYKPYVHLLHWQLSPNGRVNGIRGAVDINVFNGDRTQFSQYVARHSVKR